MHPGTTIIIADHEAAAREELMNALVRVGIENAVETTDGPGTALAVSTFEPALLFVALTLPDLSALAERLSGASPTRVIFTALHTTRAVHDCELAALDYLLRPFRPERVSRVVERVRRLRARAAEQPALARAVEILAWQRVSRVFVRCGAVIQAVPMSSVSRLEAVGDHTVVHTDRSRHVLHVRLRSLEGRLNTEQFLSVSPRYCVNIEHITGIEQNGGGQAHLTMRAGEPIDLGAAAAVLVRERLGRGAEA